MRELENSTWELQWLIIRILSNICNSCNAYSEFSSLRPFRSRMNQKCLLFNIAYIQNSWDCTNIFLPVHRLRSAKYRKIDEVRSILQIRGDKSTTVVLFFQGEQLDSSAAKLRTPFLITLSFYDNICHQFWLIKTTFAPLLFPSLCKILFHLVEQSRNAGLWAQPFPSRVPWTHLLLETSRFYVSWGSHLP